MSEKIEVLHFLVDLKLVEANSLKVNGPSNGSQS